MDKPWNPGTPCLRRGAVKQDADQLCGGTPWPAKDLQRHSRMADRTLREGCEVRSGVEG